MSTFPKTAAILKQIRLRVVGLAVHSAVRLAVQLADHKVIGSAFFEFIAPHSLDIEPLASRADHMADHLSDRLSDRLVTDRLEFWKSSLSYWPMGRSLDGPFSWSFSSHRPSDRPNRSAALQICRIFTNTNPNASNYTHFHAF